MFLSPLLRFPVKAIDVLLELVAIHPPYTPAPDLYRGQGARAHQRINLGDTDAQIDRHIIKSEEAGFEDRFRRLLGLFVHEAKIAPDQVITVDLSVFTRSCLTWVCCSNRGNI